MNFAVKEGDLVVLDIAALRQWSRGWMLLPNDRNCFYVERVYQREGDTYITWWNDFIGGNAPLSTVTTIIGHMDIHPNTLQRLEIRT